MPLQNIIATISFLFLITFIINIFFLLKRKWKERKQNNAIKLTTNKHKKRNIIITIISFSGFILSFISLALFV